MPIQYQPVPEFQVPNLNLMGSYAQGVALAESQADQERKDLLAGITATKEARLADQATKEAAAKEQERAAKHYDALVNLLPAVTKETWPAWRQAATAAYPGVEGIVKKEFDPEHIRDLMAKASDDKEQILQQHFGDTSRFIRVGRKGGAEVVPGTEVTAPGKQKIVDLGDKGQFLQNETTGQLTPVTPSMLQGGINMPAAKAAISNIESGGDYGALGPVTKSGDRAHGKYQVMGENIPKWTKQALGVSLTPQQFLNSPEAQERVFEDQFSRNAAKYGSAQDAASVWFSGKPLAKAGNRADILGTTTPAYVNKFNAVYGGQGPVQNAMVSPVTGANAVTPATPVGPPAGVIAQPQMPVARMPAPVMPAPEYPVGSVEANNQKFGKDTLESAGYDPKTGEDKISKLIMGSTSGGLQSLIAGTVGYLTGEATPGMEKIAQIKTIVNDAILKKLNGKLGAGISNEDRNFIQSTLGNLDDPSIPANQRLAAWNQVKQVLSKYAGFEQPTEAAPATAAPSGGLSVSAPNGKTYTFKDKASADAFRKAAGL